MSAKQMAELKDYDMGCCDGDNSPALIEIAKMIYLDMPDKSINIRFDHGLGDCVHFIALCKVLKDKYNVTVKVQCEENKRDVFRAGGVEFCDETERAIYHRWTYPANFNYPETTDGNGSKIFGNILMKSEIEAREFYNAVCDLDIRDMLPSIVTDKELSSVQSKLKGLPEPFVLLHLWGTNMQSSKNLNNHIEIYNELLDVFDGTLILLDWDRRATRLDHSRIRHLDTDLHIRSIPETAALYNIAAASGGLMIGVDSGPYHLAAMHPIPTLGVFHHHYPACISLPSPKAVCMTRNADSYKPCNAVRRKRWNIVEYSGDMPPAKDIAKHARRIIDGPRYSGNNGIGNDVMMQQWVRDWLRKYTSLCARADRDKTMDYLLREMTTRFFRPNIVETGCIRSREDWSAGNSTYIFAAYLYMKGRGELLTIDNNLQNLDFAVQEIKSHGWDIGTRLHPVCSDSVEYLKNYRTPIDVLYLDSLDVEHPNHANYALQEVKVSERLLLNKMSIVVFDDTAYTEGRWIGKGALAVPYLLDKDWKILALGYQVVMSRKA